MTPDIAQIKAMLSLEGRDMDALLVRANDVKLRNVGEKVYLRGLVEYSNYCRKNCCYCGIRRDSAVERYRLSGERVLAAAKSAYENDYGSVVIQGGEVTSEEQTDGMETIIKEIKKMSGGRLGITLSLGEQGRDTYGRWFDAGAHRYLLRVESASRDLYSAIHPRDALHDHDRRVQAMADLRDVGYQVGTGVMIGLPGQTMDHLARDIMFMRDMDIDMCGMGPYVESRGTPVAQWRQDYTPEQRLLLSLKMIAVLRIVMPDINIASTTALQALDPRGRRRGLAAGANVIMPNITPADARGSYSLYDNKPLSADSLLEEENIGYGTWGDSPRYLKRQDK